MGAASSTPSPAPSTPSPAPSTPPSANITHSSLVGLREVDAAIASAEAALQKLRQRRGLLLQWRRRRRLPKQREGAEVGRAAQKPSCSFPPASTVRGEPGQADVRLRHPFCEAVRTPLPSGSLSELAAEGVSDVAVLPSLLVPCCAHSGTTFLWRCMQYAFHPERVCGSVADRAGCEGGRCGKQRRSGRVAVYAPLAADWSRSACGSRRYLLPGLAGNVQGHWDYRKEWFFYGGGGAAWPKGWEDYAGVELPLCYWEREYQRLLRVRPLADTLAHSRALCSSAQPSGGGLFQEPSSSLLGAFSKPLLL